MYNVYFFTNETPVFKYLKNFLAFVHFKIFSVLFTHRSSVATMKRKPSFEVKYQNVHLRKDHESWREVAKKCDIDESTARGFWRAYRISFMKSTFPNLPNMQKNKTEEM